MRLIRFRSTTLVGSCLLVMSIGCTRQVETTSPSGPPSQEQIIDSVEPNPVSLAQSDADLLSDVSQAIAYSGYRAGQHPDRGEGAKNPTKEEVLEDLEILSRDGNFSLIRLYDSGENSALVLSVIAEHQLNIKVMLGIWLQAEVSNHERCSWLNEPIPDETLAQNKTENQQEVDRGIALANANPETVIAVSVGNEALVEWNDHLVPIKEVTSYVEKVKSAVEQPVTVAENYKWWAQQGHSLSKLVDFVTVHVYPVWEEKDIDSGMSYTIENLTEVRTALPDAKLVVGEAGWASVASNFGDRASEEKQKRYFDELMAWAAENNITTFFFEAFDENWKGDPNNEMGAEKHWGIFTIDRKPKLVMQHKYPDLN